MVVASTYEIKESVMRGQRPDVSLIPAEAPDFFKNIITRCWDQSARLRPLFSGLYVLKY